MKIIYGSGAFIHVTYSENSLLIEMRDEHSNVEMVVDSVDTVIELAKQLTDWVYHNGKIEELERENKELKQERDKLRSEIDVLG